MTRYLFQTGAGGADARTETTDLPDLDAARVHAAVLLTGLLRDAPQAWDEQSVTVSNEAGLLLFILQVTEIAAPAILKRQA